MNLSDYNDKWNSEHKTLEEMIREERKERVISRTYRFVDKKKEMIAVPFSCTPEKIKSKAQTASNIYPDFSHVEQAMCGEWARMIL